MSFQKLFQVKESENIFYQNKAFILIRHINKKFKSNIKGTFVTITTCNKNKKLVQLKYFQQKECVIVLSKHLKVITFSIEIKYK